MGKQIDIELFPDRLKRLAVMSPSRDTGEMNEVAVGLNTKDLELFLRILNDNYEEGVQVARKNWAKTAIGRKKKERAKFGEDLLQDWDRTMKKIRERRRK